MMMRVDPNVLKGIELLTRSSRRRVALLSAAGEVVPQDHWHALVVAPGMEIAVDNVLRLAGARSWIPVETGKPRRRSRHRCASTDTVTRVVWPGYVFVRAAWTAQLCALLRGVEGVLDAVGGMLAPYPIDDAELAERKAFLAKREGEQKAREAAPIAVGDHVYVLAGNFQHHMGVVASTTGRSARVRLALFGGHVVATVPLANLGKCA